MLDCNHSELNALLAQLYNAKHRQLLLFTGSHSWVCGQFKQLFEHTQCSSLVLSQHCELLEQACWPEHLHQILGQEFDLVVYDGFSGIIPNKFAAASGTVKAGGLLILLLPEVEQLDTWVDPAIKTWCCYGANATRSHFLARWRSLWQSTPPWLCSERSGWQLPKYYQTLAPALGNAQQQAVLEKISAKLLQQPPTPILLSANRGRGKSSLLGMLAAKHPQKRVLICSRHYHALTSAFRMRAQLSNHQYDGKQKRLLNLEYIAPDALLALSHEALTEVDIILVDEAATLPVPLLTAICQLGYPCVFSSTLVGYEGNGRGYTLRFKRYLEAHYSEFAEFHLDAPIRYAQHDPLERQINQLLILDSQHQESLASTSEPIQYVAISQQHLVENEVLLEQVFSLLVLAHYQTSVNDLRQLLDAPNNRIFVALQGRVLVAVCVIHLEGNIDPAMAAAIIAGKRRPSGHMLVQQLATTLGESTLLSKSAARIVRIAVHPSRQHQGIGKELVHFSEQQLASEVDYFGTSFGLTATLANFWSGVGYQAVKLGFKKDKASGEYALLMVKNAPFPTELNEEFKLSLCYHLAGLYQSLSISDVEALLCALEDQPIPKPLLERVAHLEKVQASEHQLAPQLLRLIQIKPSVVTNLSSLSKSLIIRLILQQHKPTKVLEELKLSGKKSLTNELRNALRKINDQIQR